MKAMTPSSQPGALRRYGPLVAVLGAIAVLAALVLVDPGGGGRDASSGTGGSTAPPNTASTIDAAKLPEGVMPYSVAKAQGTADRIDWGKRCDTATGVLALPVTPAPECFAPFEGDNGGETTPGVTKDAVKVVVYTPQADDAVLKFIYRQIGNNDTPEKVWATYRGFNEIAATYYETYGRRVELIRYEATGPVSDAVAAAADAETIARDIRPFAVIGGPLLTSAFADTLAADKVLCVSCTPTTISQFYIDRAPYVWDIMKALDDNALMVAQYVGKRLSGHPASYGGEAVKDKPRRFGLIYVKLTPEAETAENQFEADLAKYGVTLTDKASYTDPLSLPGQAREILARMKDEGVTSILFEGDPLAPQTLTQNATQQDYFPEWVLTGTGLVDSTVFGRTYDQQQWGHAFGPSNLFARVSPDVAGSAHLYEWFWGHPPEAQQSVLIMPNLQFLYGIMQGMGPKISPEAFQQVIFGTTIIKGNVLAPQISWGNRGLWPLTDYGGIDDQTEVWWNPAAAGQDELGSQGNGMLTYANGGRRYLPGQWPSSPPQLFGQDPNPVTIYTEPPPGITLPQYTPLKPGG